MATGFTVSISQGNHSLFSDDFEGTVILGRQRNYSEPLFTPIQQEGGVRIAIAPGDWTDLSRGHVRLEPLANGKVRIENCSTTHPLLLRSGQRLERQSSIDLDLPVTLSVSGFTIRVHDVGTLTLLPQPTLPPNASLPSRLFPTAALPRGRGDIDRNAILDWLTEAAEVLQAAADSPEFFDRAVGAAVAMVGLDSAQLLLREEGGWGRRAIALSGPAASAEDREPNQRILATLLETKKPCFRVRGEPEVGSLSELEAVVAAPILDPQGNVLGALYGERWGASRLASTGPITELEARLIELLARGVAAGLARLEHEKAAVAARARFEMFFTPRLAREMARRPDQFLEARAADVSVLFADVRHFSRMCESLTPALTMEWVQSVLDALSECVLAEDGVLVNYIGDELMAMWGAPDEQPDHARQACRAALAMLQRLPELNARWQGQLSGPIEIGIGINSGPAQVGNTGSRYRFSYGPLGNTVNLASRTQGVTRQLQCRLLVTRATQERLGEDFRTRRLGAVRVRNIDTAVELHELLPSAHPDWPGARDEYERALGHFEAGEFSPAARTMGNWRLQHPEDGPALVLLYRAARCMVEGPSPSHPVWTLTER